jgi:ABC-type molybdate transport system substrate-binding protein
VFPANTHLPIIYPVASTAVAQPSAVRFLSYLQASGSVAIFRKYGFAIGGTNEHEKTSAGRERG